jgi:hypothetical protein
VSNFFCFYYATTKLSKDCCNMNCVKKQRDYNEDLQCVNHVAKREQFLYIGDCIAILSSVAIQLELLTSN